LRIAEHLADLIGERGPITVAAFMDFALYDREVGYYARSAQRSGRAGDFFTSVDVGPLFGELLAVQVVEIARLMLLPGEHPASRTFDLVEAGAGNGRLSADILRAIQRLDPDVYATLRLHLVETSAAARAAQHSTLGDVADRLVSSGPDLPERFEGVLIANELLDAMPVHQLVMREDGLKETYVSHQSQVASRQSGLKTDDLRLTTIEALPSSASLQAYLDCVGVALEPGWRAEIGLAAVDWIRSAARRLARGVMLIVDYGHEARELYSVTHSAGTLTSFARHRSAGAEASPDVPPWLLDPGERDITAHVDFTSVRAAAEAEGLTAIAFLDQTYFLMVLLNGVANPQSAIRNPQFKTLILPGGLGSTMKVLILGRDVGAPALAGCSFKVRAT